MHHMFYTIIFFGFTVHYFGKALKIFGSSSHSVVMDPFTISCSGDSNNQIIVLTQKTLVNIVANFINANPDNTCNISGSLEPEYTFRCVNDSNTLTYSTTIPGRLMNEELHLSNWTCRNPFKNRIASMILHVDVPVTNVTITPTTVEIPDTRDKNFTCNTNAGRPAARIQWFLSDGKNLTASASQQPDCIQVPDYKQTCSSELTYKGSLNDHGKQLFCEASNVDGKSKISQNVSINISYGPGIVVLSPSTLTYTVTETTGSVGPITCTADCRPDCTRTWNGPYLYFGTTSELNLKNITRSQAGEYYCTANNSVGTNTSGVVDLVVKFGPYFVVLSPSTLSYTVTETTGRVGTVNCTADCKPDCTLAWSGPNLPVGTKSELTLLHINRSQAGEYYCTANNSIGTINSRLVEVIVNYGPTVVDVSPSNLTYTVIETTGSIGPITCKSDCRPNCTISWSGPNLPDSTASVLNIKNITRKQAGNYTCTASNGVVPNKTAIIRVIVNYPPGVEIKGNVSYSENDTALFQCVTDSIPPSEIKWHFIDLQNGHISQKLTHNKNVNFNKTYIEISKMICLSMGTYVCQANNSVGIGKGYLNITVTCAPRLNKFEYNIIPSIGVKDNEPLNVTVPILSYPMPWIYWQLIGNETATNITDGITNTFIINRHTSNLFIKNMTEDTFGSYAIYAGNGIGTGDNIIAIYNVQSSRRPNPPSNVTCIAGSSYIIVNWQPEFDGGSSQSFRVFYRSTEESLSRPHNENISDVNYHPAKIENLIPSTVYWLKIHASNIHNFTASKEVNCNTSAGVEPETNTLIAVGVGAGLGSAVLVLGVVIVVICVLRRLKTKATGNDKELIRRSNDDDDSDNLKENPLYVSSGRDVVYSQPTRDNNKEIDNKKQKLNKLKDKGNKEMEMGCVYENSDNFMKKNGEQINANKNKMERNAEPIKTKQNKDGLIYADLDLAPVAAERRFIIRGLENKSIYADIDLNEKADPLPSDDEDEPRE